MIYLDHASTTPVLPAVIERMGELRALTGNASSQHAAGRAARRVVEESRESLAAALGARPSEVIWTSGGTEADNLAVKGLYWARKSADWARTRILVSAVEHHAVLDTAYWLAAHEEADVVLLPVDATGRVDVDAVREEIEAEPDTVALVSLMWANNEVGTLQPVREVTAIARRCGIPVHTDAVQALGQTPLDFEASGVDAMTVTAHKAGGPVGTGALLVRRGLELTPVLHGGGQERQVRSGTLDVAGTAGFALAAEAAVAGQAEFVASVGALRDRLVAGVRQIDPTAVLNGAPVPDEAGGRLPGNAHFSFPGCSGDTVTMVLDSAGIACSTGSACSAGVPQVTHVLLAMGQDERLADGAVRFTLGHTSTDDDVDALLAALPEALERARRAGRA